MLIEAVKLGSFILLFFVINSSAAHFFFKDSQVPRVSGFHQDQKEKRERNVPATLQHFAVFIKVWSATLCSPVSTG